MYNRPCHNRAHRGNPLTVSERSPVTETVCSPVVELKESRDLQEVRGEEVE